MNKKIKILIVDDDEDTRKIYADVFKNENYEVEEAEDGLAGLDKATTWIPDVLFTGIIMPKMDGFSLMEALKKNVATANIPVLISSHMGREEDRQKANSLGAKFFIVRGFTTPKEVVEKVKMIFEERKEYNLEINPTALDAPKLAQDLNLGADLRCPEPGCNQKLVVRLSDNNGAIEAKLVCPSCGWQAK
jgi:CheY-like chemotaxis protein